MAKKKSPSQQTSFGILWRWLRDATLLNMTNVLNNAFLSSVFSIHICSSEGPLYSVTRIGCSYLFFFQGEKVCQAGWKCFRIQIGICHMLLGQFCTIKHCLLKPINHHSLCIPITLTFWYPRCAKRVAIFINLFKHCPTSGNSYDGISFFILLCVFIVFHLLRRKCTSAIH